MKTSQLQSLIQAVTGRGLVLATNDDEIPLNSIVTVLRPFQPGKPREAFRWKTPKKEDSLLRSFVSTFCSKYLEPDPETYSGDTWEKYQAKWENPETHWDCSPWFHHRTHQLSKEKLRTQVLVNFSNFDVKVARLGFYPTNYGIGLFTVFGGAWVETSLEAMRSHLTQAGIPFKNELSEAGWVTRFVIRLDKNVHARILGNF
jgi:hypothetical protein